MQSKFNYIKTNPLPVLIASSIILSYFFGFFLNENSSGGALPDFKIHLQAASYLEQGFINFLNNYKNFGDTHSPIYIIFLDFINIDNNLFQVRFTYTLICILLPFYFYKCLKIKFLHIDKNILLYLSLFFFVSPYFRSLAFWPGDENLALIFFVLSIFYYLKFNKKKNKEIKYLFLNILFLALSAYIRPIYCFFSIFFFYSMIINNFYFKKFYISIISNITLALPAFYYVFIQKNFFFTTHIDERINLITSLGFTYTTIFFYLLPFILIIKKIEKISVINLLLGLVFLIFFFYFFKYDQTSGGGFFYNFSKNFIQNKIIFYFILFISIIMVNSNLELRNKKNIILFFTLFFLELDSYFYQESFDPILIILLILMFNIKLVQNFFYNLNYNKINLLFLYLFLFLIVSIIKNHNFYLLNV
jgi:hypothetical protein